ncbi:MAG: DoxX family protein [Gemmatimonadaceae bacterium]
MPAIDGIDSRLLDAGLLVVRVVFGLVLAAHGAQKLFGWFGGYGLAGTGGFMESLGFRPGSVFATFAGLGELIGGLLLALGFLGPVGPALLLSVMLVASITVHRKNGLFVANNGIEVPLLYAAAGVGLAMTGPGRYSIDAAFDRNWLLSPTVTWIVLGIGLLGGIGNLALRRPSPASPPV